jgi:1,4-alpha-glucan branching enzyme
MPGTYEEKFAQLRLFYGYWMTHPGKKLLFMGSEWGQFDEWKDSDMLDWMVLDYDSHRTMQQYVKTLNRLYTNQPSLWERDNNPDCFQWIDVHNAVQSVISFIRRGNLDFSVIVANFSRNDYQDYRIGVPEPGLYRSFLNSNDLQFGGTETQSQLCYTSEDVAWHGHNQSISLHLPPFTFLFFNLEPGDTH